GRAIEGYPADRTGAWPRGSRRAAATQTGRQSGGGLARGSGRMDRAGRYSNRGLTIPRPKGGMRGTADASVNGLGAFSRSICFENYSFGLTFYADCGGAGPPQAFS